MKHNAKVLYAIDGDFSEFETLKHILVLGEEFQLELTLFDVAETIAPPSRLMLTSVPLNELRDRAVRKRLAQLEALVSMTGHRSCTIRARTSFGKRAEEIASEATQGNYDLVIKRSEKGSTDKRLIKNCACPVWVLKPEDYTESGQIIVSNAPRMSPRNGNQSARICMQGI